jgi:[acyl-carrier-protein] S-malonyltransferase
MNNFINQTSFKNSSIYIVSNYTGEISNNNSIISQNLSKQMSNRVRWVESVLSLEKNKDINIIEIGPGRILTGLIKRISNNFNIKNIEFISDIESLENGF